MRCLRRLVSLALLLAPLLLFVHSTSAAAFKRVHEGAVAPDFSLPTVAGPELAFGPYHDGPLTVVTFWALWNEKSEPLLRDVQSLVQEFQDKGVKAVAINVEGQTPPADLDSRIQEFARKLGLTFPLAVDRKLEQFESWGVVAVPATAFVAKDGKVLYEFSGHPAGAFLDMREKLVELLGIKEQGGQEQKPKHERYKPAAKAVGLNFGLARTLFERGQFEQAVAKVEKVLADDPNFPDAHALRAVLALALEQAGKGGAADGAREGFAKALALDPHLPLALAGTAYFARKGGDLKGALEQARKAVEFSDAPAQKTHARSRPEATAKEGILDAAAPQEHERPVMKGEGAKVAEKKVEPASPSAEAQGTPEAHAGPDVPQTLAAAETALAANDTKGAGEALDKAISALLAIPQGARLKKNALTDRMRKPVP